MANIPIWPGTSSFSPGDTPFGFYDYDVSFQQEADKVAKFCAQRLGYPIMEVELQDIHFYTAFEEAITTYGNELYAFKIRQDYLSFEGASSVINVNNAIVTPSFAAIIRLSEQYGEEAGTGGNIDWNEGLIPLSASVQDYDLGKWAIENNITGGIEIKRVFYEAVPAVVRFFDPYAGTGMGMQQLLDNFGWGNYSPAINFLMMPINYDLQKLQAIEFNDQIRKSQFSFEIINNKLKIFPIPTHTDKNLVFQYVIKEDRLNNGIAPNTSGNQISNVSNVPFTNPVYSTINSVGKQWIYEYVLAISKEMLGLIRGKYQTVPIPNSEATLNHGDLLTDARTEKLALIQRLREYFDDTSRNKLLEARSQEADYKQKEMQQVPLPIYIY
jgi:hypothetical protein